MLPEQGRYAARMVSAVPIVAVTAESPGLLAALLAGLLSFLSPCVLPLVPSYVAFITGTSTAGADAGARPGRLRALSLGAAFVFGFSVVFMALGASASALGSALALRTDGIARAGGVLVIMFGLILMGIVRIPGASRDTRIMHVIVQGRAASHVTSVLVGAGFAAGWSPCIGPVLASILTLAAAQSTAGDGMLLLAAYSAGLAIPFLVASIAIDRTVAASNRLQRMLPSINRICGVLLIAIGLLMVTGTMSRLSAWAARFTPGWIS